MLEEARAGPVTSEAVLAQPRGLRAFYLDHRAQVRGALGLLAVAATWELVGRYIITSKLFFAPLSAVFGAFLKLLSTGELQRHIQVSSIEFVLGFGLAAVVGIGFGILVATNQTAKDFSGPLVSALYATPIIALAPLFILWLGLDIASKVAVVFLMALFPVLINTASGIRSVEDDFLQAAHSFGASRGQVFIHVLIPAAIPFIVAGLRLGVGRGITGIVVAELFGSRAGLGFLLNASASYFDTASLFVAVLILAAAGIASMSLLEGLERRIAPWRQIKAE